MTTADFALSSILSHTNTPYRYPGNWGQDSRCGVRIVRLYERVTVILTEYPSNPGTSVTNRAEMRRLFRAVAEHKRSRRLRKNLSTLPLPWGRRGVECESRMPRRAQIRSSCAEGGRPRET